MVEIMSIPKEETQDEMNFGRIIDGTVTISATPELIEFVAGFPQLQSLRTKLSNKPVLHLEDLEAVRDVLTPGRTSQLLTGDDLDRVLDELIEKGETFTPDGPYLHELLANSSLNLPENPEIPRNPELAARVERLRFEQAEVAYQAMTKNVAAGKFHKEDTVAYQMDMMNRHLIAVGQIILSVGAGFTFGFFGAPLMVGGLEFGVRVLLGLLAAVVIAVAELYFLGKYIAAEDEIEDKKLEPKSRKKDELEKTKRE